MKHTLRSRDTMSKLVTRKIANGRSTSLCLDLWINHKSLVDLLGLHRLETFTSSIHTVSTIVQGDRYILKLLPETREFAQQIRSLPIQANAAADYWEICGKKQFNFSIIMMLFRLNTLWFDGKKLYRIIQCKEDVFLLL